MAKKIPQKKLSSKCCKLLNIKLIHQTTKCTQAAGHRWGTKIKYIVIIHSSKKIIVAILSDTEGIKQQDILNLIAVWLSLKWIRDEIS